MNSVHELPRDGSLAEYLRATDILRSPISASAFTPNDEGLEMDVQDDFAGILTIAWNAKAPQLSRRGFYKFVGCGDRI